MPESLLTPVLSRHWDDADCHTLSGYTREGGYSALPKALAMDPDDLIKLVNKLQDTFNNLGTRKFVLFGVLSMLNEVQRRRVGHASASCSTCCSRRQSDCLY